MSWCLQCGSKGSPERAIGVDDEGEPACAMHRSRPEFNQDFVDKQMKQFKIDSVEPAKLSPPQATKETADMKVCAGFEGEVCTRELPDKNSSGMCTRHYARMTYRKTHPKVKRDVLLKSPKASVAIPVPTSNPVVDLGIPPDAQITLTLPAWKVSRLLAALL